MAVEIQVKAHTIEWCVKIDRIIITYCLKLSNRLEIIISLINVLASIR